MGQITGVDLSECQHCDSLIGAGDVLVAACCGRAGLTGTLAEFFTSRLAGRCCTLFNCPAVAGDDDDDDGDDGKHTGSNLLRMLETLVVVRAAVDGSVRSVGRRGSWVE